MTGMPTVMLGGPVESVKVIESKAGTEAATAWMNSTEEAGQVMSATPEEQLYARTVQVLDTVAKKLDLVCNRMIVEHRQAIAKLAVEIARKILAQKVKDGDYEIETVIQEALNNAPSQEDITVKLNPQDLSRIEEIQQKNSGLFAGIKFIGDASIGPAQCVIDTPRGKIEAHIEEHLEQVSRALCKAV